MQYFTTDDRIAQSLKMKIWREALRKMMRCVGDVMGG